MGEEPGMIIVSAELEFENQQDRDEAILKTTDIQMATRQEEAGCLAYCFAADPAIATRIQVYELWENSSSLAAHFQHPNYTAMVDALVNSKVVSSSNRAYLAEKQEPVYHPDGSAKSAFFEG